MTISRKTVLIFFATLAMYGFTRSLWLDEWDSVQFALGLEEFNLWKHQPHPPGYPVYIFLGRILTELGFDPVTALVLLGCVAGALFVTLWFRVVLREYGEPLAWLVAAATAFTPAVWLTATKAVTDLPAAAALSSAVLFALAFDRSGRRRDLVACALACALTTGLRPQFFAITAVLLLTVLLRARAGARAWGLAVGVLLLGQALWLVPTCVLQARLDPRRVDALAYPHQVAKQWQWRLDKPNIYVGAGDLNRAHLAKRWHTHVRAWYQYGLGLGRSGQRRGMSLFLWAGLALALVRNRHGPFWRSQLPWAVLLGVTMFCCLPEDRRYYVALTPLMWIAALSGWWSLPRPWSWLAVLAPLWMFSVVLPIALAGHREPPAPVQMIRHLQALHPAAERARVWLLLEDGRRHGQWYARDFRVALARTRVMNERSLREAAAVYTDAAAFSTEGPFAGCVLEPVGTFTRDAAIYPKHTREQLFRMRRPDGT